MRFVAMTVSRRNVHSIPLGSSRNGIELIIDKNLLLRVLRIRKGVLYVKVILAHQILFTVRSHHLFCPRLVCDLQEVVLTPAHRKNRPPKTAAFNQNCAVVIR